MIHLYNLAIDDTLNLDQRYAIARRMNLMRRYHKLKGDKPMELTRTEANVYEAIKSGYKNSQAIATLLKRNSTTINQAIRKLEQEGALIISGGRFSRTFKVVSRPYEMIGRKSKPKVSFTVLRRLIKEYGTDSIRYVNYRVDADPSYIAQKIGVKPRDVIKIRMALGA